MNRNHLFNAAIIVLFLGTSTLNAQSDPGIRDTLRIDSVISFNTEGNAEIPIWFSNDEALTGLEVTFSMSNQQVTVDSFVFNDLRIRPSFRGLAFNTDSSKAVIFASDSVASGTGMLGRLFVRYPKFLPPEVVSIDSTSFGALPLPVHATFFSTVSQIDSTFFEFVPEFRMGYLDIQNPPLAFDSIWLNDIEVQPGESFSLDVNFFNEDSIVELKFALDYDDTTLVFDSISLLGTRPMPFPTNSPLVQPQNSISKLILQMSFNASDPLLPGTGILSRLYFTVSPAAPETTLIMDTTVFAGLIQTIVVPINGIPYRPFFNGSTVTIKIPTDVRDITDGSNLPVAFSLAQNYPNPFNPTTQIQFSLPSSEHVKIEVFNILGQSVRNLVDKKLPAGLHEVTFDGKSNNGSQLASGIYLYRFVTESYRENKKMLLLK